MTSKGLVEIFEGVDTSGGKFGLIWMGSRTEGLACTDQGARTPIGVSGNFLISPIILRLLPHKNIRIPDLPLSPPNSMSKQISAYMSAKTP